MKKYIKPATLVITLNLNNNILVGSDPNSVSEHGLQGFNGNTQFSGRRNSILDDDEEDW